MSQQSYPNIPPLMNDCFCSQKMDDTGSPTTFDPAWKGLFAGNLPTRKHFYEKYNNIDISNENDVLYDRV